MAGAEAYGGACDVGSGGVAGGSGWDDKGGAGRGIWRREQGRWAQPTTVEAAGAAGAKTAAVTADNGVGGGGAGGCRPLQRGRQGRRLQTVAGAEARETTGGAAAWGGAADGRRDSLGDSGRGGRGIGRQRVAVSGGEVGPEGVVGCRRP